MKLAKSFIIFKAIILCCLVVLHLRSANAQKAEIKPEMKIPGSQVISISTDEMKLRELTVDSGTVVVWLNTAIQRFMEIEFTGKQVVMACDTPMGFIESDKGSFISRKILPGSVASLCFIEKGEYDYEVVLRKAKGLGTGGKIRTTFKGKIIVK